MHQLYNRSNERRGGVSSWLKYVAQSSTIATLCAWTASLSITYLVLVVLLSFHCFQYTTGTTTPFPTILCYQLID